jgi:hypothetical protein
LHQTGIDQSTNRAVDKSAKQLLLPVYIPIRVTNEKIADQLYGESGKKCKQKRKWGAVGIFNQREKKSLMG